MDSSFPSAQFHINEHEVRAQRDRDKNGGGLISVCKEKFYMQTTEKSRTKI